MKDQVSKAKKSVYGFTLVELLTVVAIIIILMGLLIPSLYVAREKANQAKCASNMRQLLIALNMYEQDNKVFPSLANNGDLITALYPKYVDSYEVFKCPSFRNQGGEKRGPVNGNYTHYDYNPSHPIRDSAADNPSFSLTNTVLLIDTIWNDANPRHSKGSNLGFSDGHVEWYPKSTYNGSEPGYGGNTGWANWGKR